MLTKLYHALKMWAQFWSFQVSSESVIILKNWHRSSQCAIPIKKSKIRLASTRNIWKLQQLEKAVLLKDYTAEFVSTEIYSRPFLQWCSLEGFKIPQGSLFTLILYQDKTNTSWPWVFWKHTYTYFQGTKTLEETLQTWIKLHPAWWDLGNIRSPENMAKWGMY